MSKKIKVRLDKKLQKQKKEQAQKRMKIFSRIAMSVIAILVGCLFSAMIYHLINSPRSASEKLNSIQTDPGSLNWDYDKIISSPANSEIYVQTIIKGIIKLTPGDFYFSLGNYYKKDAKSYFMEVLASDLFNKNLELITQAKESLKSNPQISIIIIPDHHFSPLDLIWTADSKKRQNQIKDFIRQKSYPYVFVEGFSGEFKLKNMYQGYLEEAKKGRMPAMNFEEFKSWNEQKSKDAWYADQIAENSATKVIGVDDNDIVFLLTSVKYLEQNTDYLKSLKLQSFKHLDNAINFTFRDQLLLAKIIIFCEEHQIRVAPFVVGSNHFVTLPYHCKLWGINCSVEAIDPSFVAPQIEKLEEFKQKHGRAWPGY